MLGQRSDSDSSSESAASAYRIPVALYVPNLLGYARIALSFWGLYTSKAAPGFTVLLWVASASLDLIDGVLARRLNQCSALGILLDVAADNILRTVTWVAAIAASGSDTFVTMASCAIICVEWITMLSTQLHAAQQEQKHWKLQRSRDPRFIRSVFRNNFVNPLGSLCMYGLFSAGMFTYGTYHVELRNAIPLFKFFRGASYFGRLLAFFVESWLCSSYLLLVIQADEEARDVKVAQKSIDSGTSSKED